LGREQKGSISFVHCRLPTVGSKLYTVLFVAGVDVVGPTGARVRVAPAVLRAGSNATLTCVTESANPAAHVTWWTISHDGRLETRLATVAVRESQTAVEYGGSVVVSRAEVVVDSDDDWKTVACLANGTRTATTEVQLRVRRKSRFSVVSSSSLYQQTLHLFVDSFHFFRV